MSQERQADRQIKEPSQRKTGRSQAGPCDTLVLESNLKSIQLRPGFLRNRNPTSFSSYLQLERSFPSIFSSNIPPTNSFSLWNYNCPVASCPWGESHHGDRVQLAFPRIHTHDRSFAYSQILSGHNYKVATVYSRDSFCLLGTLIWQ